jgi:rod shape-determining protein MreB and related proteins
MAQQMTMDVICPTTEEKTVPKTTSTSTPKTAKGQNTMSIGLDLGTLFSCYVNKLPKPDTDDSGATIIPSVVGYAEEGILSGILPGNNSTLFGDDALANELHLRLAHPLSDGVVSDVDSANLFLKHIRSQVDPEGSSEVLVVIGVPAVADSSAKDNLKKAAKGAFDGVLFIPEPFLAALGHRDESRLDDPDYQDPVANSLFIDVGAGTTDFCIVQGYFPKPEDQLSIPFAGNEIDAILDKSIREAYPEVDLPLSMIRKFKEEFSYVGEIESGARVKVPVEGKPRKIEIGKSVGEACNELLRETLESTRKIIATASSKSVFSLLQNIILTGGGSRIRNFAQELQKLLLEDGYENPLVTVAARESKPFVALGAMKVAQAARDDQWIRP